MKKLSHLLLLGFISMLTFASCDDDETTDMMQEDGKSIVDIATGDSSFDLLVEALTKANLVSTLQGDGPFTVLAPDNAAFERFLNGADIDDVDVDVLKNILLNHVISGALKSTDLPDDGYANTLATGAGDNPASIYINKSSGVRFNDASNVVLPDGANIEATNGVVHVVSEVIAIPNIVEFAQANPAFSILVDALILSDTDYGTSYVSTLSGDGPFTVFAPTNDAFVNLLATDPTWNSLADIPEATLKAVLEYHVVTAGNFQSTDLSDNMMVPTLGGGTLTVDLSSGVNLETSSSQSVAVAVPNVQGSNGVIHGIGEVLLP